MKKSLNPVWMLSILCTFLFTNLVFQACKKDSLAEVPTEQVPQLNGVVFEDGRLKFSSEEHFNSTLQTLKANQKDLSKFEAQFAGFVSSRTAYQKLLRAEGENLNPGQLPEYVTAVRMPDGDIYLRPSVDFILLSYLANTKGIYQVGDVVYKITYYKRYSGNVSLADVLETGQNLEETNGIEIETIVHEQQVVVDRAQFQCEWGYWGSPYKRKFHGEVNRTALPGFEEVRVDFDHYKRGLFGSWNHEDAPAMSFSGTVRIKCCATFCASPGVACVTSNFSTSMSGSNESEIFDVLNVAYGTAVSGGFTVLSPSSVTFRGLGDNNTPWASCTSGM